MSSSEKELEEEQLDLDLVFVEPPRPPTPPKTTSIYKRYSDRHRDLLNDYEDDDESADVSRQVEWNEIELELVGAHPLWGHYLWNASRALASFLDAHSSLYSHKNVLELGAGGGLPGIVTALNGAKNVVLTDYPDTSLIDNLSTNVAKNVPVSITSKVSVQARMGYIWGTRTEPLLDTLSSTSSDETSAHDTSTDTISKNKFDLIILSDLIFNHSQHDALLSTCSRVLRRSQTRTPPDFSSSLLQSPPPTVLISYTHHRPHLSSRDMEFFTKAQAAGWMCKEIFRWKFDPMFPDDPGPEEVRSMVYGWVLT